MSNLAYAQTTLADAGLTLPADVANTCAQIDALQHIDGSTLDTDTLAAAVAGKTPAEAVKLYRKAVADADSIRVAREHARAFTAVLSASAWRQLTGQTSDVLGQYRGRFDQAAAVIVEAVEVGITRDTTAEDAIALGAGPLMLRLADAIATLDQAVDVVAALDPNYGRSEFPVAWFVAATGIRHTDTRRDGIRTWHYDNLEDGPSNPSGRNWLTLVELRHTLTLNDPDGRQAVLDAHAACEAGQQRAEAAAVAPRMSATETALRRRELGMSPGE